MDFGSFWCCWAESEHDRAATSRLRDRERAISRFGASVVREHRPVVRSALAIENQDPAFAKVEFGMLGLGFHRGAALSFVTLRLSGQAYGSF